MKHIVIPVDGDPCPRCGRPTEVREHTNITDRERQRPFYYRRWFYCRNPHCKTTLVMPRDYRVFNEPDADAQRRLTAILEQLNLDTDSDWVAAEQLNLNLTTVDSSAEVTAW